MEPVRLGIPKGSLENATIELFAQAGWRISGYSRNYFPSIDDADIRCSLVRAQEMAGYSLGGADLLRRAMGKKIAEEMAKERPKFIEGSVANGVSTEKAGEVFDLLEKFANYGFNKSHAAAYAVVSYQTAWLKANHPVEFMAGVMNCDLHLTDKLGGYAEEVRRGLGIEIVPPCVNRSEATFSVSEGRIVYALGALKNVGVEAMRMIERARDDGGPFRDLFDFARRVDLKALGKRALEMMARGGALEALEPNRRRAFEALDRLIDAWGIPSFCKIDVEGHEAEVLAGLSRPVSPRPAGSRRCGHHRNGRRT